MSRDIDAALDRLVSRQYGAFSRGQAVTLGFTRRMVDGRLTSGRWRRLDEAVYAHAAYRHTWEQRCIAAVLGKPAAVLGGKTAAVVYELPDFRPGPVQLTARPDTHHGSRLARVRRSWLIEPHRFRGFRVNALPITLVELAPLVSRERLDRAVEDAVLRGLTSMDAMADWCSFLADSRRPGLARLRSIVRTRGDGFVPAESELEAMLFAALDDPRIPPVTRQAPFPWAIEDPQRVDGFLEAWGILLEADGRRWHARLESMERDRCRDQEAVRHGYLPLRFGWVELKNDPARVRSIVLDAGSHRRTPTLGGLTTEMGANPPNVAAG
jgi:hypothetical protein